MALKKTVPTVKILILCVCVCGGGGGGGGVLALNGCRLRGRGIAADGPTVLAWAPPPAHTNIDTHTHTSPGDTPIKCSKPGYTQMSSLVTRSLMTSAVHTHTHTHTHTLNIHTPSLLGQPQAHALISPFIVKHTHADSLKITYNYTHSNGAQVLL